MALKIKVAGTWRDAVPKVKVAGTWRDVSQAYVKVGGVWRELLTKFELSFNSSRSVFNWITSSYGTLDLDDNGTHVLIIDYSENLIMYELSTPWVVTSNWSNYQTKDLSAQIYLDRDYSVGLFGGGIHLYGSWDNSSNDIVYHYKLSTAYNLSTATFQSSATSSTFGGRVYQIRFNDNGTKMYVNNSSGIRQYSCSTPYTLNGISLDKTTDLTSYIGDNPLYFDFTSDGLIVYCNNITSQHKLELSTPFDLDTIINSWSTVIDSSNYYRAITNPNGTQLTMLNANNDDVEIYDVIS